MSEPLDRVLDALRQREGRPTRTGDGWLVRCPGHEDRHASLSVGEGDDGRLLLHRFAGCLMERITDALGLAVASR
jgi:hypothetical protein